MYIIGGQVPIPANDVIEVFDMTTMQLSTLKAPNGTDLKVATVTNISLIYPCMVPLEDKNSIVVTGGTRTYPSTT